MRFVAIDFETANEKPYSACAVGLVEVEDNRVVRQESFLIRPPESRFLFTDIHGLTWEHVREAESFLELWPRIEGWAKGADFFAAHNSGFDRGVLNASLKFHGIEPPSLPFVCTVQLARETWKLFPTKLPNVCDFLGFDLKHHDAMSDALACAEIVRRSRMERPELCDNLLMKARRRIGLQPVV